VQQAALAQADKVVMGGVRSHDPTFSVAGSLLLVGPKQANIRAHASIHIPRPERADVG
jgi:hypothetical protein